MTNNQDPNNVTEAMSNISLGSTSGEISSHPNQNETRTSRSLAPDQSVIDEALSVLPLDSILRQRLANALSMASSITTTHATQRTVSSEVQSYLETTELLQEVAHVLDMYGGVLSEDTDLVSATTATTPITESSHIYILVTIALWLVYTRQLPLATIQSTLLNIVERLPTRYLLPASVSPAMTVSRLPIVASLAVLQLPATMYSVGSGLFDPNVVFFLLFVCGIKYTCLLARFTCELPNKPVVSGTTELTEDADMPKDEYRFAELMNVQTDIQLVVENSSNLLTSPEFSDLKADLGDALCDEVTTLLFDTSALVLNENNQASDESLKEKFNDRLTCLAKLDQYLPALPEHGKNCNMTLFETHARLRKTLSGGMQQVMEALSLPDTNDVQSRVASVRIAVDHLNEMISQVDVQDFMNLEYSIRWFLCEYDLKWVDKDVPIVELVGWDSIMFESAPLTVSEIDM